MRTVYIFFILLIAKSYFSQMAPNPILGEHYNKNYHYINSNSVLLTTNNSNSNTNFSGNISFEAETYQVIIRPSNNNDLIKIIPTSISVLSDGGNGTAIGKNTTSGGTRKIKVVIKSHDLLEISTLNGANIVYYQVYDIHGNLILANSIVPSNSFEISTSNFNNGNFIIVLTLENNSIYSEQFIIN